MNGGKISGNTGFFYGGGVSNSLSYTYTYEGYEPDRLFTMKGGEISGNTASSYAGGVYVNDGISFDKTGGTISNNNVKSDSGVVLKEQGHSVYAYNENNLYTKQKDTASGPGDNLSYNSKFIPPVWSGNWDN